MKDAAQRLAWALEVCRRAQMRSTPIRQTILEFLAARRMPVTLEMVFHAEGVSGHCDVSTAYRTLMMFKNANLVRSVGAPGKVSYFVLNVPGEGSNLLICRRCDRITELPLPQIMIEQIKEISAAQGFSTSSQDCEVHGLCVDCQVVQQTEVVPSKLASGLRPC